MSHKIPVPVGEVFGKLKVVSAAGVRGQKTQWLCRCECGKEIVALQSNVRRGFTKSCGCHRAVGADAHNFKHGLHGTNIYAAWSGMIQRCYNPNVKKYHRWGGRGIGVCEFLRASPANLFMLIGDRPGPKLSVGRIDNNSGYHCGTCAECSSRQWPMNIRWETPKQQARNKSNNRLMTFGNETRILAEWAERAGLNAQVFVARMERGLDPFAPLKK